jgi:hypothetical protein
MNRGITRKNLKQKIFFSNFNFNTNSSTRQWIEFLNKK